MATSSLGATGDDRGRPSPLARLLGETCAALQAAGLAEDPTARPAPAGTAGLTLDARLEQIQHALDRIESRLAELERELAVLIRPGWPF